jgi:hypothetical protein
MGAAEDEEMNLLYKRAKDSFMRYKLTGDITKLNPKIELFGPSL